MNKIIIFALGVAAGSTGTYFAVKKVIEARTDKEIESVVKTFKERLDKIEEILTDEQKEKLGIYSPSISLKEQLEQSSEVITNKEIQLDDYDQKVKDIGYSIGVDLSEKTDQHVDSVAQIASAPYVITEEEFGEFGNEEETLILYADGILATEDDDPIDDIENLVGDCLKEFGEYDEVLYVRNQEREIDYTILKSEKMWKDIIPEVNN